MLTRRQFSQLLGGAQLLASHRFANVAAVAPAFAAQDMGAALTQSRDPSISPGVTILPFTGITVRVPSGGISGANCKILPSFTATSMGACTRNLLENRTGRMPVLLLPQPVNPRPKNI